MLLALRWGGTGGKGEKQYRRARPGPSCLSVPASLVPGPWLAPWKLLKCVYRDSRGHWAGRCLGPALLQGHLLRGPNRSSYLCIVRISVRTRRLTALWQVELRRVAKAPQGSLGCGWAVQTSSRASLPGSTPLFHTVSRVCSVDPYNVDIQKPSPSAVKGCLILKLPQLAGVRLP